MAIFGPGAECPVFVLDEQKRTNPTFLHTPLQSAAPNCHPSKRTLILLIGKNPYVGSTTSTGFRMSYALNVHQAREL
jgi:hypothetical protein